MRVYLAGRVFLEGETLVDESEFPGPLGRTLLAVLAIHRGPVTRSRISEILWDGSPSPNSDKSLNPLVSRLRNLLRRAGGPEEVLVAAGGTLEFRRLADVWIDVEEATKALDAAEGALRRSAPDEAWSEAAVATSIFRRPFLAGVDLLWVEAQRRRLSANLVRGLEVACDVWVLREDPAQAIVAARQLVEADPFRESSHRRLMKAHLLEGNRAAALRAYSACEELLKEELGVEPSAELQQVYEEALSGTR